MASRHGGMRGVRIFFEGEGEKNKKEEDGVEKLGASKIGDLLTFPSRYIFLAKKCTGGAVGMRG